MCEVQMETCSFFTCTRRKARKQHQCACCETAITPSQIYYRFFSVFERIASTESMCVECRDAMSMFGNEPGHMEVMPSWLFLYASVLRGRRRCRQYMGCHVPDPYAAP